MVDRAAHGPRGGLARLVGLGQVEGVAGHAVAKELGVDVGAPGDRVLPLLEHQDRGALADDEAVATRVEGTAGALGLVVAGGERPHGRERPTARYGRWAPRRLRRTSPTASPRRMIWNASPSALVLAAQAVHVALTGPLSPSAIETFADAMFGIIMGMKKRADAVGAPLEQHSGLLVEDIQTPDARTRRTSPPRTDRRRWGARHPPGPSPPRPPVLGVARPSAWPPCGPCSRAASNALDLGGDGHRVAGGVEAGDGPTPERPAQQSREEVFLADTDRRDHPDAGDHHPAGRVRLGRRMHSPVATSDLR